MKGPTTMQAAGYDRRRRELYDKIQGPWNPTNSQFLTKKNNNMTSAAKIIDSRLVGKVYK